VSCGLCCLHAELLRSAQRLIEENEKGKADGANFKEIIEKNLAIREQLKEIDEKLKEMDRLHQKELKKQKVRHHHHPHHPRRCRVVIVVDVAEILKYTQMTMIIPPISNLTRARSPPPPNDRAS
jgi:hypothetical protein